MADGAGGPRVSVTERAFRRAWAEIDLGAVRHNARLLSGIVAPAELCAVVKANGYGHGAVAVAGAALEGGASRLAVATVEEGVELRDARITAPVLVLSEPPPDAMQEVVAQSLTPTLYTLPGAKACEEAASRSGRPLDVHVKVDTGMHRVGADPAELAAVVGAVVDSPALGLGALWTHLSVADGTSEEDRAFTTEQLRRFELCARQVAELTGAVPVLHAANSAAAICRPDARFAMVRCGIAVVGSLPSPELGPALREAAAASVAAGERASSAAVPVEGLLRPAMSVRAEVSHVRRIEAGERPSYGRLRALTECSTVATVPLGYADGIPRRFFDEGGTVLVGGRRRPLAGAVTMDQIMVDCGPDADVSLGDEVVLIGEQGGERITAWDWADVLGTISYEVVSRMGPRLTRVLVDGAGERSR